MTPGRVDGVRGDAIARRPSESASAKGKWSVRPIVEPALLVITVVALAAGVVARWLGAQRLADGCWIAATAMAAIPALVWVVSALRRGRAGVDLIAVLALAGTFAVREYLAGALIAVMLASGRTLDAAAQRRAARDLTALLRHAARSAHRRSGDRVETVALEAVQVGDLLVVGPGEVVPVDGRLTAEPAVLDESALTGEPLPVRRDVEEFVRSGVVNAGGAFDLCATATAQESTYAGIVRLAREANAETAPVVRLADRYAGWFLPLTLAIAGIAWWVSGSAVRAVAVLVVATPCPLLLAAPVAIVSGLSRCSRLGVVVRSGGALETLGRASTMVLDKTGTLTAGEPSVLDILPAPGWDRDEVLRLAASADQLSPHVLATAIVAESRRRRLCLAMPASVTEEAGLGVRATVEGRAVRVGTIALAADEHLPVRQPPASGTPSPKGVATVWVWADGACIGALLLSDPPRPEAAWTLRRLRAAGMNRLVMLTGDRREPAVEVGSALGLDEVLAELSPAGKVEAVREEQRHAVTVMVGDGVNDAPALAAATVGIAMGARGATASSEAADIVLTTDRLDRVADAMDIARRSRRIAVQSAAIGMGLSLMAMMVAALGGLPPATGAILQEGIDVAVILNALRALLPGRGGDGAASMTGRAA